jgi:hypothetical protein
MAVSWREGAQATSRATLRWREWAWATSRATLRRRGRGGGGRALLKGATQTGDLNQLVIQKEVMSAKQERKGSLLINNQIGRNRVPAVERRNIQTLS